MTGESAAASGTPSRRKSAEVPITWMASTPTFIQPRITAYRSSSRCSPLAPRVARSATYENSK